MCIYTSVCLITKQNMLNHQFYIHLLDCDSIGQYFFRDRDFTCISLRRRAERVAYTKQLWDPQRSHSAGYRTTEKVVRKPNDNRIARKVTRRDPPPQT